MGFLDDLLGNQEPMGPKEPPKKIEPRRTIVPKNKKAKKVVVPNSTGFTPSYTPAPTYSSQASSSPAPKPKSKKKSQPQFSANTGLDDLNRILGLSPKHGNVTSPLEFLNRKPLGPTEPPVKYTSRREPKVEVPPLYPNPDLNTVLMSGIDSKDPAQVAELRESSYLQTFLQDISKQKDLAPEGSMPAMPKRFMKQRQWDQDYIESLKNSPDFGQNTLELGQLLDEQAQDRMRLEFRRSNRYVNQVKDALSAAQQAAYEGDLDYLQREHPDLDLTPASYESKYGITSSQLREAWIKRKETLTPEQIEAEGYHYRRNFNMLEKIEGTYAYRRDQVDQAIKNFERKYEKSLKFAVDKDKDGAKEAQKRYEEWGGIIPPDAPRPKGNSEAAQRVYDAYANEMLQKLPLTYDEKQGTSRVSDKTLEAVRKQVAESLGVNSLPTAREILIFQTQTGMLDTDDTAAVHAAYQRARNPYHPDTLAIYAQWAKEKGADEDKITEFLDKNLTEGVNATAERLALDDAEKAQVYKNARDKAEDREQTSLLDAAGDFAEGYGRDMGGGLKNAWDVIGDNVGFSTPESYEEGEDGKLTRTGGDFKTLNENLKATGESDTFQFTIDMLSRPVYGVAATLDNIYSMNQDKGTPWYTNLMRTADPVSLLTGQSVLQSADELIRDPLKAMDSLKAGYDQLIRPAETPGWMPDSIGVPDFMETERSKTVTPTTFSQVIANAAMRDGVDDTYDEAWYQHTAGFALDVAADPLNFVGLGVVDDVFKTPVKLTKDLSEDVTDMLDAGHLSSEVLLFDNTVSPIREKAYRAQEMVKNLETDEGYQYFTDRQITGEVTTPFDGALVSKSYYSKAGDSAPVGESITLKQSLKQQQADIKLASAKMTNDVAVEHLDDTAAEVFETTGIPTYVREGDLLVDTLHQQVGSALYMFEKELKEVSRGGMGKGVKIVYGGDEVGRKAFNLNKQADELEAQWETVGMNEQGRAQVAALRKQHDEIVDDPAIGGTYLATDLDGFLEAGGEIPKVKTAKGEKSLSQIFATASGMKLEDFPFSDLDIAKALIHGPKLAAKESKAIRERVVEFTAAEGRIRGSMRKKYLDKTDKTNLQEALDHVHTAMQALTIGGAVRYLKALEQQRTVGHVFTDLPRAKALHDLKQSLMTRLGADDLDTRGTAKVQTAEDNLSTLDDLDPNASEYTDYTKHDFLGEDPADYASASSFELRSRIRGINQQLKDMQLDGKDGRLTSLPPQLATDISKLIPARFKKDGSIDKKALKKLFYLNEKTKRIQYHGGMLESAEEHQVVRIMQAAMNSEYRDVYHQKYSELYDKKKAGDTDSGMEHNKALDDFYAGYGREKPTELSTIHGVVDSEWSDMFPDGIGSWGELRDKATQSKDDFYRVLFTPGSPFAMDLPQSIRYSRELFKRHVRDSKKLEAIFEMLPETGGPLSLTRVSKIRGELQNKYGLNRVEAQRILREASDEYYDDFMNMGLRKSDTAVDVPTVTKSGAPINRPVGEMVEGAAPVDSSVMRAHQNFFRNMFKNTNRAKAHGWDAKHAVAKNKATKRTADSAKAAETRKQGRAVAAGLTDAEKLKVRVEASSEVIDLIVGDVVKHQKVRTHGGNERMTINETARQIARNFKDQVDSDIKLLEVDKKDALRNGENAKAKDIAAEITQKQVQRKEGLVKIERNRIEAHETKKLMVKAEQEERLLQTISMPARISGRGFQLRLFGYKKNLQWTNAMFNGAQAAEKILPAKAFEYYSNNWVRPSKQFDIPEFVQFRATIEGKTPVIFHAHLTRLAKRMGDTPPTERTAMLKAFREGRDYEGAYGDFWAGTKQELDEIESILNGKHESYRFKRLSDGHISNLTLREINRFLPNEYKLGNLKALEEMHKAGDKVTLDLVLKNLAKQGSLNDPHRLAWVMRLAADTARSHKAMEHTVAELFGVRRLGKKVYNKDTKKWSFVPESSMSKGDPAIKDKARVIERFKDQGWVTIPELGDYHYFPAESAEDIRTLVRFMGPEQPMGKYVEKFDKLKFTQMSDTALGIWKQGVTIYNPGYYTRNGIGEILASWLDGVSNPKYYSRAKDVIKYIRGDGRELADLIDQWSVIKDHASKDALPVDSSKVIGRLKGGQTFTVADVYRMYIERGLKSTFVNTDLGHASKLVNQGPNGPKTSKLSKFHEGVQNTGEHFEDYLRLAHFIHAMENSGFGTLGKASAHAAERVRKYHFDYTDFSRYEKALLLRAFPFYKWTRRGAPLMLAHLFATPGKMMAIPKAMDAISGLGIDPVAGVDAIFGTELTDDPVFSTQDVHEDKNGFLPNYGGIVPAWVRDLWAYQLNPTADDEYGNFIRIQTPQFDGLNAMAHPLESAAMPLMNPFAKMVTELTMNKQIDPDSSYEIYGGDYNKAIGMSPFESVLAYSARNLQPGAGFLSKLYKNGKLGTTDWGWGGKAKEGEYGEDYDTSRDVLSYLSGIGLYQARNGQEDVNPLGSVGIPELSEESMFSGRQTGRGLEDNDNAKLDELLSYMFQGPLGDATGSEGFGGSGWKDFGKSNWKNFKWRNFGGGYGGSGGYSSGSVGLELWELLKQLERSVEHGKVID